MKKHMCLLVLIIFCFCLVQTATAQTPTVPQLTPSMFAVTTNKAKYNVGEEIKIMVTNLSKTRVRFDSYQSPRCAVQRWVAEKNIWSGVPSVACSCSGDVQCNMSEAYIEPGKTFLESWSQVTSWCDGDNEKVAPAKAGKYRVLCPLNEISSSANRVEMMSKEFEIGKDI